MRPYYYALLGVDPGASQEEIRMAYRRMAKKVHPDINKAPDAHAQFLQLQKAWQTLSDPVRRRSYDYLVKRYPHYSGPVPGYERTSQARPQQPYSPPNPPPPNPPYRTRRSSGYKRTTATPEQEAKSYYLEWTLVGAIFLLLVTLPFSIKWIGYLLLPAYQVEAVAQVVSVDRVIGVGIDFPDNYYLTTVEKGVYYHPLAGWTWENGMPIAVGDKFVVHYLPWSSRVFRIKPHLPDEKTLTRYCFLIWDRGRAAVSQFDTVSGDEMGGLFLFAFCDSTYHRFGVDGLASVLMSWMPHEISAYNNSSTFEKLQKKPGFREMVANVNRLVYQINHEISDGQTPEDTSVNTEAP